MHKKIKATVSALFAFLLALPALAATEPIVIAGNKISTYDDFDYELWTQRSSDPVSMELTGGGTFKCDWDAENVLFRTGKKLGSRKTYDEFGNISIDYKSEYNITNGSVSYLCVYGWTIDPLIEFYVVENYGSYKPPGGTGYKGTIEVDGGTYEVYVATRVEQPSIQGTKTFEQYFSVRVDKRTEGTITLSDHFKAWEEMGLDMSGKMYEVSLCVEGYKSSGNANVYSHVLTVGDAVFGTATETLLAAEEAETTEDTEATETSAKTEEVKETETPENANDGSESSDTQAADNDSEDENTVNNDEPNNILPIVLIIIAAVIVIAVLFITVKRNKSKTDTHK